MVYLVRDTTQPGGDGGKPEWMVGEGFLEEMTLNWYLINEYE